MIRPVSYTDILDDEAAAQLLHKYSSECSISELGRAVPRRDLYAQLESSGGAQCFGVYEGDALIGFANVLVYVLPHYGIKIGTSESIFLDESKRKSSLGLDLIARCEGHARDAGCVSFIWTAPAEGAFDRILSARRSARHTNNVYVVKL